MRRRARTAMDAMVLVLATLLVQVHAYNINFGGHMESRGMRHARMLALEGDSPWAYRLLSPAIAEIFSVAFAALGLPEDEAREYGYVVLRFIGTAGAMLLFHRFCQRFLDPLWAFTGAILFAALHGASYTNYWFQPASPLDLLLWLLACELTLRERYAWLPLMVFLGTLNRETAVFIIAIHGMLQLGKEPLGGLLARCTGLGVLWAAAFLGVRQVVTPVLWATDKTPWEMLLHNLDVEWLFFAASFLGVWTLVPLLDLRRVPETLRRLMVVMIPYSALLMMFGRIREVRLLLPLAIPFIPAFLIVLREWLIEEEAAQAERAPSSPPQSPGRAAASSHTPPSPH